MKKFSKNITLLDDSTYEVSFESKDYIKKFVIIYCFVLLVALVLHVLGVITVFVFLGIVFSPFYFWVYTLFKSEDNHGVAQFNTKEKELKIFPSKGAESYSCYTFADISYVVTKSESSKKPDYISFVSTRETGDVYRIVLHGAMKSLTQELIDFFDDIMRIQQNRVVTRATISKNGFLSVVVTLGVFFFLAGILFLSPILFAYLTGTETAGGLMFFFFMVFLVLMQNIYYGIASMQWPQTVGTILEKSISESRSNNSISYSPKIRYSYQVDGCRLTNTTFSFKSRSSTRREDAEKYLDQWELNGTAPVYYNSRKPSMSVLEAGIDGGTKFFAGLFLVGIIVSGVFAFKEYEGFEVHFNNAKMELREMMPLQRKTVD